MLEIFTDEKWGMVWGQDPTLWNFQVPRVSSVSPVEVQDHHSLLLLPSSQGSGSAVLTISLFLSLEDQEV